MPKYMWMVIVGGVVTYLVHKTHKSYTWVAAAVTVVGAFLLWKKG